MQLTIGHVAVTLWLSSQHRVSGQLGWVSVDKAASDVSLPTTDTVIEELVKSHRHSSWVSATSALK